MSGLSNNEYFKQVQQGQADARQGLTPNPNLSGGAQTAYTKGYTGKS